MLPLFFESFAVVYQAILHRVLLGIRLTATQRGRFLFFNFCRIMSYFYAPIQRFQHDESRGFFPCA